MTWQKYSKLLIHNLVDYSFKQGIESQKEKTIEKVSIRIIFLFSEQLTLIASYSQMTYCIRCKTRIENIRKSSNMFYVILFFTLLSYFIEGHLELLFVTCCICYNFYMQTYETRMQILLKKNVKYTSKYKQRCFLFHWC